MSKGTLLLLVVALSILAASLAASGGIIWGD